MAKTIKKAVVVEKKQPQKSEKTSNVNEPGQTPEPIADSQIAQPTSADDLAESGNAPTNQVGQKLDKELTGNEDAYVTADGRIMVVQQEDGDNIFAGEHGKNAEWFPKDILKSWTKKS